MTNHWYAVQVHAGREKWVASYLSDRGLDHLLLLRREKRRWTDRFKTIEIPLFAGYVFCRFGALERSTVLSAPGALRVVGCGRTPLPIEDEEIAALQILNKSEYTLVEWPYLTEGDSVRLEGGALDGLLGIVVRAPGGYRVVVSVTIMQRSVAVEVERSRLTPVTAKMSAAKIHNGLPVKAEPAYRVTKADVA
jgi:transcription antitermination factor NusG